MITQQNENETKTSLNIKYFYLIGGLAFIWNLMGVLAFIGQLFLTTEMIAKMPQAEQNLYNSTPIWVTVAFAIAVFSGTFGCLILLMKKALSLKLLMLSLIGVLTQMFHSFFISNSYEVYGPSGTIMPIMVIIIAIALVRWAKRLSDKGVLS